MDGALEGVGLLDRLVPAASAGFVALGRIRKDTSASKTITIIPSGGFDLQVEKLELHVRYSRS